MNNYDRGMIKWMPFNSVVSGKQMIQEIIKEKNKKNKPILSNEQKNNIEHQIISAYYENKELTLTFFYSGNFINLTGIIKKIDFTYHKIYFNNQVILFDQIINII